MTSDRLRSAAVDDALQRKIVATSNLLRRFEVLIDKRAAITEKAQRYQAWLETVKWGRRLNFLRRKRLDMTNEISHADASVRVDALRAQLGSIDVDLASATKRRDDHECEAVLSGAEIDASFGDSVLELSAKHSAVANLLRRLEERLGEIHRREVEAEAAAKRAVTEKKLEDLSRQLQEKTGTAIAAVFTCGELFLDLVAVKEQIRLTLVTDLPGDTRRSPGLPRAAVNFLSEDLRGIELWADDLCALGFAEFVPDSMPSKKRFLASKAAKAAAVVAE